MINLLSFVLVVAVVHRELMQYTIPQCIIFIMIIALQAWSPPQKCISKAHRFDLEGFPMHMTNGAQTARQATGISNCLLTYFGQKVKLSC